MSSSFYTDQHNSMMPDDPRQRIAKIMMARQQPYPPMPYSQPRNIAEGLTALGDGIAYRMQKQNSMFPDAPGSAPSPFVGFANLFSGGHNGGLY